MATIILFYILFLIIFGIFSYLALMYLAKFGYKGDACRLMIPGYIIIAVGIVAATFIIFGIVAGFAGGG